MENNKCLERNNGNAIFLYDKYNIKLHRKMKLERILKNDKV